MIVCAQVGGVHLIEPTPVPCLEKTCPAVIGDALVYRVTRPTSRRRTCERLPVASGCSSTLIHKRKRGLMCRSRISGGGVPLAQADDPRYEKGDMVWALSGHGLRLSGVVIGYHADRDLYWVVYTDDIAGRTPSVVQEWRLSSR